MATFFRVISVAEHEDILATGKMRAIGRSVQGKHFWTNIEDALKFRDLVIAKGLENACIIVRVTVPDSAAGRFADLGRIDGVGQAWFAELGDLDGAIVELVPT